MPNRMLLTGLLPGPLSNHHAPASQVRRHMCTAVNLHILLCLSINRNLFITLSSRSSITECRGDLCFHETHSVSPHGFPAAVRPESPHLSTKPAEALINHTVSFLSFPLFLLYYSIIEHLWHHLILQVYLIWDEDMLLLDWLSEIIFVWRSVHNTT